MAGASVVSNGRALFLCALVIGLVLFTDPTPFWLAVMAVPVTLLVADLYSEWRRDTHDLRSLHRNEQLRKGHR